MNDDGSLVLVMNLGADPAVREGFPPELATSGWLVSAAADGTLTPWVDVAAFETANDPDKDVGGLVDSNPYGIASVEDGYVVADAGGNDLLHVAADGTVSLVAVFPPETHEFSAAALAAMGPPPEGEGAPAESGAPAASMAPESEAAASGAPAEDVMVPVPVQAVPTSVVVGPDGAYYVGQLTGAPFPVGGASVWRVVAGEEPTKYASGFTNIIGLDFARGRHALRRRARARGSDERLRGHGCADRCGPVRPARRRRPDGRGDGRAAHGPGRARGRR